VALSTVTEPETCGVAQVHDASTRPEASGALSAAVHEVPSGNVVVCPEAGLRVAFPAPVRVQVPAKSCSSALSLFYTQV